jgi:hypothetical protein
MHSVGPCDDDKQCPTGDSTPLCSDNTCLGELIGACTIDPFKDCPCEDAVGFISDPVFGNLDQQQQILIDAIGPAKPATSPQCNNNGLQAMNVPAQYQGKDGMMTAADILYSMRESRLIDRFHPGS